jgi:hypothetical protein
VATVVRRGPFVEQETVMRLGILAESRPMHLCPVCLRKLPWNLQAEPGPYLRRLEAFCREHGLEEADWYTRAVAALGRANER